MKIKSKDNKKIKESDVREIEFSFLKFNFSFINNQYSLDTLEDEHKLQFLTRIQELSERPIKDIAMMRKDRGYELINKEDFKKEICTPIQFNDAAYQKRNSSDKFMVLRLYPNNNPLPTRIIGKFCSPVFYVIYIDRNHKFL